jgi:hypothetical protein
MIQLNFVAFSYVPRFTSFIRSEHAKNGAFSMPDPIPGRPFA